MPSGGRRRGRAIEVAVRLLPALAGVGLVLLAAAWSTDRAAAPATAWLGLTAAAALAPLLVVVRRERLPLALLALLAPLAAIYLPRQGALPLAPLAALLAGALTIVAVEGGRDARARPTAVWLALALATTVVLHFDRLWTGALAPRDLWLLAAPALAAPLLAALDRASGAEDGGALPAAAVLVAAGPGFAPAPLVILAAVVLLARVRPAVAPLAPLAVALAAFGHEPLWAALALCGLAAASALRAPSIPLIPLIPLNPLITPIARIARGALALVALGALLAAAPPWLRARPIASVLAAASSPPLRLLDEPLAHGSVALSADAPTAAWPLGGAPVRAVVVESFVSDGAALACGREVAIVRLAALDGRSTEVALTVGSDAGEWASGRPDVAAALGCSTLEPHTRWLPASGRFFGRTFRARLAVDPPLAAERIEIERAADLPSGVRIHLERVASER